MKWPQSNLKANAGLETLLQWQSAEKDGREPVEKRQWRAIHGGCILSERGCVNAVLYWTNQPVCTVPNQFKMYWFNSDNWAWHRYSWFGKNNRHCALHVWNTWWLSVIQSRAVRLETARAVNQDTEFLDDITLLFRPVQSPHRGWIECAEKREQRVEIVVFSQMLQKRIVVQHIENRD